LTGLGVEPPPSVLELGSISAVRVAVINGSSPTVISRRAVREDLERGTLVEVPIAGLRIERHLRAVWTGHTGPSRLAVDLLDHLPTIDVA